MQVKTESLITGSANPTFARRERLTEWGFLSVPKGAPGIWMSHHRADAPGREEEPHPLPIAPVYAFALPLRAAVGDAFLDGHHHGRWEMHPGSLRIQDGEESWSMAVNQPFHGIAFYIDKTVLNESSREIGAGAFEMFDTGSLVHRTDQVMWNLGQALLPSVRKPTMSDAFFVSSVFLAARLHIVRAYGGFLMPRTASGRPLADWQERRAREMIADDLSAELSIEEVATACGLSASHFAHAFKQTTGKAPHQWRNHCRLERAKMLLMNKSTIISDVAVICGFSDQSHFSKAFAKSVGVTPGAWRRRDEA